MDAAGMREILETEYGIFGDEDFMAAVGKAPAIMVGLFTSALPERGDVGCETRQPGCSR